MRVVLADDSLLLREGVARLLEDAGLEVVAQAGDAEDLLRKVGAHKPDLAIVDVRMPPTHTDEGLKAAVDIRERFPSTGVLVLSQYIEESYALELLSENAEGVGYLLKDRVADLDRFVDAVRRVGDGGSALDPEVVSRLLGRRRREDPLADISPREREVLALMAEGRSNHAIADGARRHRARGREARHLDLLQARPAAHGGRPPPGAGRADLPARLGAIHRRPLGGEVRLSEPRRGTAPATLWRMASPSPATLPDVTEGLLVSADDVTRVYGEGEAEVRALDGVTVGFPAGRFTADHGPVGLGQVDAHAPPRRAWTARPRARSSSPAWSSPASTTRR